MRKYNKTTDKESNIHMNNNSSINNKDKMSELKGSTTITIDDTNEMIYLSNIIKKEITIQ